MRRNTVHFLQVVLLAIGMTACSSLTPTAVRVAPTPTAASAPTTALQATAPPVTYNDPFAYCAAVGTIDTPDARYTGPKISEEIINDFKKAAGLETSTEPMDMFMKTTIWRCMNKQVYVCNFGANLPCDSKANTSKTPSPTMENYCKANPDAEFIPMSETGHNTIYSWHCVKDSPEVLEQIGQVDAAGFVANIWYPISPNTNP